MKNILVFKQIKIDLCNKKVACDKSHIEIVV